MTCILCGRNLIILMYGRPSFRLEKTVRSLMAAYDKRSWVQTTWILVRVWKVRFIMTLDPLIPVTKRSVNQSISKQVNKSRSPQPKSLDISHLALAKQFTVFTKFGRELLPNNDQSDWAR